MEDISMKLAPAFLLLVACVPPPNPPLETDAGTGDDPALEREPNTSLEPAAPKLLAIDPPQAATGPASLFAATFANGTKMSELVRTDTSPRDVITQRIVTLTDTEVELAIELPPPTGSFSRTIVSDTQFLRVVNQSTLCIANGIKLFNPLCEANPPQPGEVTTVGQLAAARWTLSVIDQATQAPVSTCTSPEPNRLACRLPARAGVDYRIVASVNGLADLWNDSPIAETAIGGVPFTGRILSEAVPHCISFFTSGTSLSCLTRNEFTAFEALDRAAIDFDPITVRLTANGAATAMESPALVWDAGNDDAPGTTF